VTRHRGRLISGSIRYTRTDPKPESRIQATSYLGLPPTHARPGAWRSDHGCDVRQDERSRQ
jgi:hypothetical protein